MQSVLTGAVVKGGKRDRVWRASSQKKASTVTVKLAPGNAQGQVVGDLASPSSNL